MTTTLDAIATPALLLERAIVEANTAAMAERAERLGVTLRPHLKTAKSASVAALAARGPRREITVSTLAEARHFVEHGFDDITYAVALVPSKVGAMAQLTKRGAVVRGITDSVDAVREIAAAAARADVRLPMLVEVDCGLHRGGIAPDSETLVPTARAIHEAPALELAGVLTHAGHAYGARDHDEVLRIARDERDACVAAAARITEADLPCPIRSVGSTPTACRVDHLEGITEMRPGVYVFFDTFQQRLGMCEADEIAVTVVASVIGHMPERGRLLVDAGGLALSKDVSPNVFDPGIGYGIVADERGRPFEPRLVVREVHQEHGIVESDGELPFERLPIGSRVRIVPNHVCMTVAAYDRYHVVERGLQITETWERCAGW